MSLIAQMHTLTLRAAVAAPAKAASSKSAVALAARRSSSLSAGASQLQQKQAPARKAVAPVQPVVAKLKTRKAAAKRFKITAGGKVVRRHAMKGHLLAKKSPARKRMLSNEALVKRSDLNNVRDCLPYAGVA